MNKTISHISFILYQTKIPNISNHLICAISGGQDSILLLISFYNFKKLSKFKLNLAYCNHIWQKKNFYAIFQLLKLSYVLDLPITIIISQNKNLSEEQGHFWRQTNFFQLANYFNINQIVLGHSLNDQVETSLWHFFRGTSPKGLVSLKNTKMLKFPKNTNPLKNLIIYKKKNRQIKFIQNQVLLKIKLRNQLFLKYSTKFRYENRILNLDFLNWSTQATSNDFSKFLIKKNNFYSYDFITANPITYIVHRPLLHFSRSSIKKLIAQNNLPIIIDETNQSKRLIRNKIRLILVPLIHYYIKENTEFYIQNYINISLAEQLYFNNLKSQIIQTYVNNPNSIKFLHYQPLAIKRLCMKNIFQSYTEKQIKNFHINKFEQILQNWNKSLIKRK